MPMSGSNRTPSGTLVIGIKGKRKGSYGIVSGYDIVRRSYLVQWTVSGEKKHKKFKRFGQWFFIHGQGRRVKENWIRVVTWGGIDTVTYLESFHPLTCRWKTTSQSGNCFDMKRQGYKKRSLRRVVRSIFPDDSIGTLCFRYRAHKFSARFFNVHTMQVMLSHFFDFSLGCQSERAFRDT